MFFVDVTECVYKHQTCIDGRPVTMEILDTSAVHVSIAI